MGGGWWGEDQGEGAGGETRAEGEELRHTHMKRMRGRALGLGLAFGLGVGLGFGWVGRTQMKRMRKVMISSRSMRLTVSVKTPSLRKGISTVFIRYPTWACTYACVYACMHARGSVYLHQRRHLDERTREGVGRRIQGYIMQGAGAGYMEQDAWCRARCAGSECRAQEQNTRGAGAPRPPARSEQSPAL